MLNNSTLFDDFCPRCGSLNLAEIPESLNSIYHGQLRCGDCQIFIKWIHKSKIFEVSITRLLQNPMLESWERKFLKAITLRNPTTAEEIVIRAIEERVDVVHSHQR